jgi:aldose sugar dehydrogenase
VHPATGEIWAAEHGPQGGDEINQLRGGNSHGWPFITGGVDYSGAPLGVATTMEGKTSAVHIFEETVAPSGLAFVWGEPALREWNADMLIGGLVAEGSSGSGSATGQWSRRSGLEIGRRIRDVHVHDGSIWVLTEHEDGEVLRLTPRAR